MKAKKLKAKLVNCIKAKMPVLLVGPPGIGKTDVVHQAAAELGCDTIVSHPVVSDPTDAKGMPAVVDGQAAWLPFGDLRRAIEAKGPTVWFLDDLGQAPAGVQAAFMQLVLGRRINGHVLSDEVVFVAATNRREDRAGVSGILEPLKGRFTIYHLEPDPDEWIVWAFDHGIRPEVIGYIHFQPGDLHVPAPTADIVNSPSPRNWAAVSAMMEAGNDDVEDFAGRVGEGYAAKFAGFVRTYRQLPNIERVLMDPTEAKVPTEPSAIWATVSALVDRADAENFGRILQYADRLDGDFAILLVRDALRRKAELAETAAFVEWAAKHKTALLG